MARKRHWMDDIILSLKERMDAAVPVVAGAVKGPVPFGYKPPDRTDEVKQFLSSSPEQRMANYVQMGPEAYREWSTTMMKEMVNRFGPGAQVLMPMLEGTPIEALSAGVSLPDDGSVGVPAAHAELTALLGFDPFAE